MKKPIKLLIVEDDPMIRRMYDRAFDTENFNVTSASDGTIVFETIKLNRPDIVLLDVMMPNFNGLETLAELKEERLTHSIPIIMLSAYDDQEIIDKALGLGAARYLVKNNVEPKDIIAIIYEVLGIPQETPKA